MSWQLKLPVRVERECLRLAIVLLAVQAVWGRDRFAWGQQVLQPFTVKDSIERVTFSDPDETSGSNECRRSPDGRKFVIVTSKGDLSSNRIKSTIWLYRSSQLQSAAISGSESLPAPEQLLSVSGVLKQEQDHSYGSLITKVIWSSDSSSLLFLQEGTDGKRHLEEITIVGHQLRALSARNQDVEDYHESHGTVAYVAIRPTQSDSRTGPKISTDLTGSSLFHALDPSTYPVLKSLYRPADLWVSRNGKLQSLNRPESGQDWTYPVAARSLSRIAISPDGNAIIAAKPVMRIKASWRSFRTYLLRSDLSRKEHPVGDAGTDWDWPWQYEYFNLRTGQHRPLVDAPSSATSGYGGAIGASWASDGTKVLLMNTFVAPTGYGNDEERRNACSVAVVSIVQQESRCLVYAPFPKTSRVVRSASFVSGSRDVRMVWSDGLIDRCHQTGHEWICRGAEASNQEKPSGFKLVLHQSLNQSPSIWMADSANQRARQLWNPNVRFQGSQWGHVSVLEWTDESGYGWKAGLIFPPSFRPGTRYPLVVQTHGFRKDQYLVDGPYTTAFAAQALASKGMVVLQLEDRSDRHLKSTEQEAKLFAMGCEDAIRRLDRGGLIDPSRVGIVGFSRTSWYVETAIEMYPKSFRAAVIVDGVDLGYLGYMLFCTTMPSCRSDHEAANGGPPFGETLSRWTSTGSAFRTDKIQIPVRIEAIRWFSLLQEWGLYSSLEQQGKTVEFDYIPEGQHILQQPQQRFVSQQGTVDWLSRWLLSDGDAKK